MSLVDVALWAFGVGVPVAVVVGGFAALALSGRLDGEAEKRGGVVPPVDGDYEGHHVAYIVLKNGQRIRVERGSRNDSSRDPQLTYESDLREEELERLQYAAAPEELAGILERDMPEAAAALIAHLYRRKGLYGHPDLDPLLDAIGPEVDRLLGEHVARMKEDGDE